MQLFGSTTTSDGSGTPAPAPPPTLYDVVDMLVAAGTLTAAQAVKAKAFLAAKGVAANPTTVTAPIS